MVVAAFARSATRAWAIYTSLLATGPLRRDAKEGEIAPLLRFSSLALHRWPKTGDLDEAGGET